MAKIESSFRNMMLSLTLISLGASAALGFVFQLTSEPIKIALMNKKMEAIKQVVPEFDNNPGEEMFRLPSREGDSLEIYPARKEGKTVGFAVKSLTQKVSAVISV